MTKKEKMTLASYLAILGIFIGIIGYYLFDLVIKFKSNPNWWTSVLVIAIMIWGSSDCLRNIWKLSFSKKDPTLKNKVTKYLIGFEIAGFLSGLYINVIVNNSILGQVKMISINSLIFLIWLLLAIGAGVKIWTLVVQSKEIQN
ncbi:hypothetical protein [Lactobacillus sp. PV012]|uniref:hypothetical protein n=1 Tax=Lactobacillus sp. PV012 TaxID=2594494 RepID=UPI00223ED5A6|nr:hypothetical protein [Lactobacillus sp. PV012]QNQ82736.1 hypothetical protein FP433_06630 [Lactobacillus sp. PV012]